MKIAATGLISLMLAIFFGSSILVKYLVEYQRTTTTCLKAAMQIQDQIRRDLEALLKLNPQARVLRRRHQTALARLAKVTATGNPAAIAAAVAHLKFIVAKRKALAAQQEFFIEKARYENQTAEAVVRDSMFRSPRTTANSFQVSHPIYDVVADLPDMAPVYSTSADFSKLQELKVTWVMRPSQFWPASLQRAFANFSPYRNLRDHKLHCAATIEARGRVFRPTITDGGD